MPLIKIDSLSYNTDTRVFLTSPIWEIAKYLKGKYKNVARFKEQFLNPFEDYLTAYDREDLLEEKNQLLAFFTKVQPFSYVEAFKIVDLSLRRIVFETINVPELMEHLGNKRISVEGKQLTHKFYKEDGSYVLKTYDVVYEIYLLKGQKLKIEDCYVLKCWCTSTDKEHWLWLEGDFSNKSPLEAVASTIRVYKNMIPFIKSLKRQGDVLLFEMEQEIFPNGEIVALTADQYFGFLIAQS